jgi:hypothetical protein
MYRKRNRNRLRLRLGCAKLRFGVHLSQEPRPISYYVKVHSLCCFERGWLLFESGLGFLLILSDHAGG